MQQIEADVRIGVSKCLSGKFALPAGRALRVTPAMEAGIGDRGIGGPPGLDRINGPFPKLFRSLATYRARNQRAGDQDATSNRISLIYSIQAGENYKPHADDPSNCGKDLHKDAFV